MDILIRSKLLNKILLFNLRYRYKATMTKNCLTVNKIDNSLALSFRYVNNSLNVNREFNFNRNKDELIDTLLEKISTKITQICCKKMKKNNCGINIPVSLINIDDNTVVCTKTADPSNSMRQGKQIAEDKADIDEAKQTSGLTCNFYFFVEASRHKLKIEAVEYLFDVNPPTVSKLKLSKTCMVGFPIYPSELELSNCSESLCIYEWVRGDKKYDELEIPKLKPQLENLVSSQKWENVGEGFYYTPTYSDLGKFIKLIVIPKSDSRKGVPFEYDSVIHVKEGPGNCPYHQRHKLTSTPSPLNSFRVLTYNVLADLYSSTEEAKGHLFPYCASFALDMDYRKQLLVDEILGYNVDLMCLQEVDWKIFLRVFHPVFTNQGFLGNHASKEGEKSEGCAIFFKKDKFDLLENLKFYLSKELQSNPLFTNILEKINKNSNLLDIVLKRNTVLQVNVLQSKDCPSRIVIVGTTHLYFRPICDNIRILQAGICFALLRQIIALYEVKYPDADIGLIFSGDFNSCPENAVYRFLTSQFIGTDDPDWSSDPSAIVEGVELSHDLEMESAYGAPPYTNYIAAFQGCLDYIFYQTDKFSVDMIVPLPSHEEVIADTALPSIKFPSDHIALVSDFKFVK